MLEKPKRLAPTLETLRRLHLHSGNLCCFPNCNHLLMDKNGTFIAEVCHIEAAEPGGERFNSFMTNEERRHFDNLFCMCHAHHVITDDVKTFPVNVLKAMKATHEAKFSDPSLAMMGQFRDWTRSTEPALAKNLKKYFRVMNVQLAPGEEAEWIRDLAKFAEKFQRVPLQSREFLRAVAERMDHMQDLPAVHGRYGGRAIVLRDLANALRQDENFVGRAAEELEYYGVGGIAEIETEYRTVAGVTLYNIGTDWPFWEEIPMFCRLTDIPMSVFSVDLDFGQLDE